MCAQISRTGLQGYYKLAVENAEPEGVAGMLYLLNTCNNVCWPVPHQAQPLGLKGSQGPRLPRGPRSSAGSMPARRWDRHVLGPYNLLESLLLCSKRLETLTRSSKALDLDSSNSKPEQKLLPAI